MKSKDFESYAAVYNALARAVPTPFSFKYFLADYERAEADAAAVVFGKSKIRGCMFHATQAILRKVRKLGLMEWYMHEESIRKWIRRIIAVPMLPIGLAEPYWNMRLRVLPKAPIEGSTSWPVDALKQFRGYVAKVWMMQPELRWNFIDVSHRTTNVAESFHSYLARNFPRHPSLEVFLSSLLDLQSRTDTRIEQVLHGSSVKPRNKTYALLGIRLQNLATKFKDSVEGLKMSSPKVLIATTKYLDACSYLLSDVQQGQVDEEAMSAANIYGSDTNPQLVHSCHPTASWMKATLRRKLNKEHLFIRLPRYCHPPQFNHLTDIPSKTQVAVADGNCGFRCCSILLTGDEDAHRLVRAIICAYIDHHRTEQWIGWFGPQPEQLDGYLGDMRLPGSSSEHWMTSLELMAAALLFEVNILVYSRPGHWSRYFPEMGKLNSMMASPDRKKPVFLMDNGSGCHFDVVLDVRKGD